MQGDHATMHPRMFHFQGGVRLLLFRFSAKISIKISHYPVEKARTSAAENVCIGELGGDGVLDLGPLPRFCALRADGSLLRAQIVPGHAFGNE